MTMYGRLGMTGQSVIRGDKDVMKSSPSKLIRQPKPSQWRMTPEMVAHRANAAAESASRMKNLSERSARFIDPKRLQRQIDVASNDPRYLTGKKRADYMDNQRHLAKAYLPRSLRKVPKSRVKARLIRSHNTAMWDAQTRGQPAVAQAHQGFIRDLQSLSGKVAKDEKKDRSGAAVGSGAVLGTAGLAGGGIPGVKASRIMVDFKRASGIRAKTSNLARAYGAGEFGYRHNAHHTFNTFGLGGDAPKNATRAQHFSHGDKLGRMAAEDKIIRHMKIGRIGSNVALGTGAALVATGIHSRRKRVAKRDNYRNDMLIAGGGTTAGLAGGGSLVLDSQGRKWAKQSAASLDEARRLNPKLGGYDVRQTRHRVPDVVPHRSSNRNAVEHKRIFAGRSNKATEAAGRLRGAATQQRYFSGVYGISGSIARKVGAAGALVGAAGLGGKYLQRKPKEINKADMSEARARELVGVHGSEGILPKKLPRADRMEAHQARYIVGGGPKGAKWKRRAAGAEVVRSAGIGGAMIGAGGLIAARSPRLGAKIARTKGARHLTPHRAEGIALGSAMVGGGSELYGEYARYKRKRFARTPAGISGGALTRMKAYNPAGETKP